MINSSLKQLGQQLASKQVSSVELTQAYLQRMAKLNPSINAYVTIDEQKTLAQAQAADARIAAGIAGPLTGIPIAQKDIFCAQGWRTTCSSKMLENFIAPYDAHVISQFDAAGAVNLGKTNMDEFAMGSSNETSYFGGVKTHGTLIVCLAVALAVPRRLWPPACVQRPPGRIPAVPSANPLRCAALPALNQLMA